ncbi:hypothetical protein K501DRAFT_154522, partial [Backusella circina FSU 941]
MNRFIYHDSNGTTAMYNENGTQVLETEMEVDEETHPLQNITEFDEYIDEKPPEKPKKISKEIKNKEDEVKKVNEEAPDSYKKKYKGKEKEKENFFELYYNKGISARAAALQHNINVRTAQDWAKKDQEDPQDIIARRGNSGRPPGRPSRFHEEHVKYLENHVDEKPDITIEDAMASLVKDFQGFQISKSGLHKFM